MASIIEPPSVVARVTGKRRYDCGRVEERYYSAVSGYVNEAHLGGRLVYFRVGRVEASAVRSISANSIYHKLQIQAGAFAPWLEADLKDRFDYA